MIDWKNYLNRRIECTCGRVHSCEIEDILIGEGVLGQLAELVQEGGFYTIFVLADKNTRTVGKEVYERLDSAGIIYNSMVMKGDEIHPDERALGSILTRIPCGCDLIIGIGSGTINDLCKFISYKLGIDYFIVATAPSMDGYTSNVAAMLTDGLKATYEAGRPKMVFGDADILAEAPMSLITAGVGDILGKYVCLADWKIANIVTGEYHCAFVEKLVRESIETVVTAAGGIMQRDKASIAAVMEGLVLSGIAMSYIGNSRPASGSEHHLSHYWEVMFLNQGIHGAWHGTKVAVGTVVALGLYQFLEEYAEGIAMAAAADFNRGEWEGQMYHIYGNSAASVIELEEEVHKNRKAEVEERLKSIQKNLDGILAVERSLPKPGELVDLLKKIDAPYLPEQIGVEDLMLQDSVRYAKEIRNRFGILQLLYDIQQLEDAALRFLQVAEDIIKS